MQNKKKYISERRDKTYILSYIYNTFVVRHKGVIKGVGGRAYIWVGLYPEYNIR